MIELKPLPWDSEHFGFKVGRVDLLGNVLDNLVELLLLARQSNYQLVYVFTPENQDVDPMVLDQFDGTLVDRRVDYTLDLLNASSVGHSSAKSNEYQFRIVHRKHGPADSQLLELGVLAGHCSRFLQDSKIEVKNAKRLFEIWIEKSALCVNGEQVLLALDEDGQVAGMATVSLNNQEGRIGLISVLGKYQGRGVGKQLIAELLDYGHKQELNRMRVTTQGANLSANQLYLKAGFAVESVTNTYHFWL